MRTLQWLWLLFGVVLVLILEGQVLSGYVLSPFYAIPLSLILIFGIGYATLYHGLVALFHLRWQSIQLLMVIAVVGAFLLGQYEEAAIVIVLYTLAEKLEDLGIEKSRSALANLLERMPKEVERQSDGKRVRVEEIKKGETIRIRPGEMIALDGKVIEGSSFVDESTITGEPIARDKGVGDSVFAGTQNKQGSLEVEVTQEEKESVLAKIQKITEQATREKAQTQKFIEKFSQYYTPAILVLALFWIVFSLLWGHQSFIEGIQGSLTLLVIACPSALVISTPISIYAAVGNASKKGALIKGGRYLEALGQVKAFAFDKTRTLTEGRPVVTDIISFSDVTERQLLECAAGLEVFSEHPLAESILEKAKEEELTPHRVENFRSITGKGIQADCCVCDDKHHCLGKLSFVLEEHDVPENVIAQIEALQQEGKTVVVISTHRRVKGIIALSDALRQESPSLVATLQDRGIEVVLVTGDHALSAKVVADGLNIKQVFSEQLPGDKAETIKNLLKQYDVVGMVGDGVNDAPSLALASVEYYHAISSE